MRKYSNIGTDREALFLVSFGFFLFLVSETEQTTQRKRKKEATEQQMTRERENERENERVEGKKQPKKHNHKSTTFCREKTQKRLSSLSTHHGEPRSGGNLERVTREKRERGAFLIVCGCVFSLFFLSERSARKVRERFCSFPK